MSEKLLIVESPNKINTIKKFLDESIYDVVASKGHIRDLAIKGRYGLGIDMDTFEPMFSNDSSKAQIVKEIKEKADKAKVIYLATDPDREGEAIAWHLYEALGIKNKEVHRITFNEITEPAIKTALSQPRTIDNNLVDSQIARRILDRIIGFRLSNLMRHTLKSESAGRVQSVALKIVSDREKLIEQFVPELWWTFDVNLGAEINLTLRKIDRDDFKEEIDYKPDSEASEVKFTSVESAEKAKKLLEGTSYQVYGIDEPEIRLANPQPPLKTSTLQQEASSKYGFSPTKTMKIAQELYEGIKIKGKNVGLISYPRTDATRLSEVFVKRAMPFISRVFGKEFVGRPITGKGGKNTQEAHEAIRPTYIDMHHPTQVREDLSIDQYKLYVLIWVRTVASLMAPAKFLRQVVRFENNGFKFYARSRKMIFSGWKHVDKHVTSDATKEVIFDIEALKPGLKIKAQEAEVKDHSTQPPARFTQASLVKELEESGVGRPSTFSTIISTNLTRKYVKKDGKALVPTEKGNKTIEALATMFPDVMSVDFTSEAENNLDLMASGKVEYQLPLKMFWERFEVRVKEAYDKIERTGPENVGEKCPDCTEELVYRDGRNGKFIACSQFPKCKYTRSLYEPQIIEEICPDCSSKLIKRKNKRDQEFIACSNYPTCKFTRSTETNKKKFKNYKTYPKKK